MRESPPPFVRNGWWRDGWGDDLNPLNGGKGLAFVKARAHLPACRVRAQRRRGCPALAGSERGCAGAHLGQVNEDDIPKLLLGEVRDADFGGLLRLHPLVLAGVLEVGGERREGAAGGQHRWRAARQPRPGQSLVGTPTESFRRGVRVGGREGREGAGAGWPHRYGGGQAAGQSEGQHPAAHAERYLKNGPQGEMCSALPATHGQAGVEAPFFEY